MAGENKDGGKPLIYHPTVDHGDLDRPTPGYDDDAEHKGKTKVKPDGCK